MHHLLSLSVGGQSLDANMPKSSPQPGSESRILGNAVTLFLILGIVVSLIFILMAGINWITSEGDKQKIAKARARLTWAIVGLIVMFLAGFAVSIVGTVFGIPNILSINF